MPSSEANALLPETMKTPQCPCQINDWTLNIGIFQLQSWHCNWRYQRLGLLFSQFRQQVAGIPCETQTLKRRMHCDNSVSPRRQTQRAGMARAARGHWPVHVEERVKLLGISHAAAGDREHPLGPHGEGLQGGVPRLHELWEEALHAAPAAHARHQLRQRAQHLPRRHHHGNVQVLLLQHAVSLQRNQQITSLNAYPLVFFSSRCLFLPLISANAASE